MPFREMTEIKIRVIARRIKTRAAGSALGFPFSGRGATPGEAVIAARRPCRDDMMTHQVASHVIRAKYLQYGGGPVAFRLRVTPRVGQSDLTRLGRIQPRHAIEEHLIV